ncbi:MAG: glutamine synthetase III [Spirochaetales bacterium]|nr:glutamine synthetase III [Spirochaetales bacterium]
MSDIDYISTGVDAIYGKNCFNDRAMREWLPKSVYKDVKAIQAGTQELTPATADVVASAMKDWATQKGATHYTHWFLPLTGLTAEKHDSFISPVGDGSIIMEFSGKELLQGEPDASSFPSGGLRATFEARGYTAWDVSSPAFLKAEGDGLTLCIPTAFVSYTGEALDKKTPLLRSSEAVGGQALRVLRALGNESATRVTATAGPEQEYFLVDKKFFDQRPDLQLTGRTVFGRMPAKGQEMDDHYFGAIKERVSVFMRELNNELWKLGISAKTQHNEVAPHQFELAPIYDPVSVALDSNQLVMETIRKVAARHDMAALLHEKPFAGVNGSGKHNNWSLGTDDGENLLEPGDDPERNARFLLFLSAVIKAVDTFAPILRATAANAGNDHRLGANEAPPAVISIFLGDQLSEIMEALAAGKKAPGRQGETLEIGASCLPKLPKDLTDRNRTSPFAFTGNKFEFRMPASSQSVAAPNVVLNTTIADVLSGFADRLEKASDTAAEIKAIVAETYQKHGRIVFNGNGYAQDWLDEAAKRGLPNLPNTVAALPAYLEKDSIDLFKRHNVLSLAEMESRVTIYMEQYAMQINVEAGVMQEMADSLIYPAATAYASELASMIAQVKAAGIGVAPTSAEEILKALVEQMNLMKAASEALSSAVEKAQSQGGDALRAAAFRDTVIPCMEELRQHGDAIESMIPRNQWPMPTYEDLLFRM